MNELTDKQKEALNRTLHFFQELSISTTFVADAIGIHRPTLANKIIGFKAAYANEPTQIRNRFSQEDFEKVNTFLYFLEKSVAEHIKKVQNDLA